MKSNLYLKIKGIKDIAHPIIRNVQRRVTPIDTRESTVVNKQHLQMTLTI